MSDNYLYQSINQMEPMMPSPIPVHLEVLAMELTRQSAALGAMLHPVTRDGLMELFREMNCYYSNLIEGHKTTLLDIKRALKQDFSAEPAKRALQLESVAHIQVQKMIEERFKLEEELNIYSSEFLCWIHQTFYAHMPEEFKIIADINGTIERVEGGELRNRAVQVGVHIPPQHNVLHLFLKRFTEVYSHLVNPSSKVIGIAASHHRLAWIHPFLDGNGRVIRLFSDAYFRKIKLDGHGLWTMARGLARNRARYMQTLAIADGPRQGDLDGRGNLSQKGLVDFCQFFLETAIDQVQFMCNLLEPEFFKRRIKRLVDELVDKSQLKAEAIYILQAVLLNGEMTRGEAIRVSGMSERSGRDLLKALLHEELLVSTSVKGPIRLGFPLFAIEYYFPNLYISIKDAV